MVDKYSHLHINLCHQIPIARSYSLVMLTILGLSRTPGGNDCFYSRSSAIIIQEEGHVVSINKNYCDSNQVQGRPPHHTDTLNFSMYTPAETKKFIRPPVSRRPWGLISFPKSDHLQQEAMALVL